MSPRKLIPNWGGSKKRVVIGVDPVRSSGIAGASSRSARTGRRGRIRIRTLRTSPLPYKNRAEPRQPAEIISAVGLALPSRTDAGPLGAPHLPRHDPRAVRRTVPPTAARPSGPAAGQGGPPRHLERRRRVNRLDGLVPRREAAGRRPAGGRLDRFARGGGGGQ